MRWLIKSGSGGRLGCPLTEFSRKANGGRLHSHQAGEGTCLQVTSGVHVVRRVPSCDDGTRRDQRIPGRVDQEQLTTFLVLLDLHRPFQDPDRRDFRQMTTPRPNRNRITPRSGVSATSPVPSTFFLLLWLFLPFFSFVAYTCTRQTEIVYST